MGVVGLENRLKLTVVVSDSIKELLGFYNFIGVTKNLLDIPNEFLEALGLIYRLPYHLNINFKPLIV